MIPILLRPNWLSLKNRWRQGVDLKNQSGRDVVLLVFALLVMAAIYWGTLWALEKVNANPNLAYLPPGQFLALILMFLLVMLVITNVFSAVGALFLSEDLDLVLASPVRPIRFFAGKVLGVALPSSWMPMIFIAPLLMAVGQAYGASFKFYLVALVALIPYFVIPAVLGVSIATILVFLIPVYRVREMLLVLFLLLLATVYFVIDVLSLQWSSLRSAEELLRIVAILSMPSITWLPSNWLANILQELLRSTGAELVLYLLLLYLTAISLSALAFLVVRALHFIAYSRAKNKGAAAKWESRRMQAVLRVLGQALDAKLRALLGKEMRLISRDLGQAVQVLVLLSISLIYLYNLRIFSVVESFPESIRTWWKSFLFVGNTCMGAFITTAFCARFVYPAISLEGRSYWILQSAPLSIGQMMRAKFWSWFVPVAAVSSVFFASGAVAIGADWTIILISLFFSVVMCYGIVGIAIGMGGVFAQFDWEHSSQLAAGFGNFVFMLCAIILIFFSMLPAGVLLWGQSGGENHPVWLVYLLVGGTGCAVLAVNLLAAQLALKKGEQALLGQMAK